jgi:hypothetical protein
MKFLDFLTHLLLWMMTVLGVLYILVALRVF